MVDASVLLRDLHDGVRFMEDLSEAEVDAVLAERFPRAPVGDLMRGGVPPIEMLVDGWLARGTLHWFQGPPEEGKSWAILALAGQVLDAGGTVIYADEELGRERVAERLAALSVDPDVVDARFHHYEFPALTDEDADLWAALVERTRPALVVYETGTDFLALVGASENSGNEVTRWIKAFPERRHARRRSRGRLRPRSEGRRLRRLGGRFTREARESQDRPRVQGPGAVRPGDGREGPRHHAQEHQRCPRAWAPRDKASVRDGRRRQRPVRLPRDHERRAAEQKAEDVRRSKEFRDVVVEVLSSRNGRGALSQRELIKLVREHGFSATDKWMRPKLREYAESPAIPVGMSREGQRQAYYLIGTEPT